ncbi:nuclease-related domain-containing protein [Pengzhenrongella sicca]|nr:nuclease-related domain-containing protein [Pengzhenrongella sicca]
MLRADHHYVATPIDDIPATPKMMRLRYAGTCRDCGVDLDAGVRAVYDRATKTMICVTCPVPDVAAEVIKPAEILEVVEAVRTPAIPEPRPAPVDSGSAGASARREHERRSAKREARIRDAHPRLGGLILALSDEPQSTTAWARGAKGEEVLGQGLDTLTARGVLMLHDRRIPPTRANIDHIAVSPAGVFVIDAKRYKGRPHVVTTGGLFRPRISTLVVGSRVSKKIVDGVHKQVALVHAALAKAGFPDVPIRGMLCFVDADWPLFGGSFVIDGVDVLWPKKAGEQLLAPGLIEVAAASEIHRALAAAFPVA